MVGRLGEAPPSRMPALTTAALPLELLRDSLLTLEQLSSAVTMLALNAATHPEQSPRFRRLLQGLIVLVETCEDDLGTYRP